jgi:Protein of unknown function (DUF4238)
MPLDHYISQVHLRNFYSPALEGAKMWGFSKRDSNIFPCTSKDVCRIENGSTNEFLKDSRAIEQFLTTVEPRYNVAVEAIRTRKFDQDHVYVIAGFAAYVITCSPTAMRIGVNPVRRIVESTVKILESQGLLPPAPKELGGGSISDFLTSGDLQVEVDPKYPNAIGVSQIIGTVGFLGNSNWDFIYNEFDDCPFLTSDFASAIEQNYNPRILNRIIPLTPDFAIRIVPNFEAKKVMTDLEFNRFRYKIVKPNRSEIVAINAKIAQCAERLIFLGTEVRN